MDSTIAGWQKLNLSVVADMASAAEPSPGQAGHTVEEMELQAMLMLDAEISKWAVAAALLVD